MKHNESNNKENLLKALEQSLGIVTAACKSVNLSRETFYKYYNTDPEFKKAVNDINEITLDFTENQLLKLIRDGNIQAILFYMRYKAKHRGYTEDMNIKVEHSIKTIKLIEIKKPDKLDE